MPGRNTLYFYICTGRDPSADEHVPLKRHFHLAVLLLLSIAFQAFAAVRIFIFKRKFRAPRIASALIENSWTKPTILMDLTTSLFIIFVFVSMFALVHIINFTPVQEFNCYPAYLYEYTLRMLMPQIFSFTVVLLHYYRNPNLRSTMKIEVLEFIAAKF